MSLFLPPSGKLYQKIQQALAEDEKAAGSKPAVVIKQRRPGPKTPAYGIPADQWTIVLHRVLENHEPLREVAAEYSVSNETIRRLIRTASKKQTG